MTETETQPLFNSSDVVNFFCDPSGHVMQPPGRHANRRGRAVGIAWSSDGLTWSKPFAGSVFVADDLDPDATQIHGMPAFADQELYLGQPWLCLSRYFKCLLETATMKG